MEFNATIECPVTTFEKELLKMKTKSPIQKIAPKINKGFFVCETKFSTGSFITFFINKKRIKDILRKSKKRDKWILFNKKLQNYLINLISRK